MKKIYNKNAREKALLEEAYSQVNEFVQLAQGAAKAAQGIEKTTGIKPGMASMIPAGDGKSLTDVVAGDEEVSDLSGERWGDEHAILDVNSTEDLEYAEEGDAFLFDKVDEFAQAEGEVIERESDVMKFLSQFGSWKVEDNPNGHIVIKISNETGLTDAKGRPVQYSGGFMSM